MMLTLVVVMGNSSMNYRTSRLSHMKRRLGVLRHGRDRLNHQLVATEDAMHALEQQMATLEEHMIPNESIDSLNDSNDYEIIDRKTK
jgi:hypothetical protein